MKSNQTIFTWSFYHILDTIWYSIFWYDFIDFYRKSVSLYYMYYIIDLMRGYFFLDSGHVNIINTVQSVFLHVSEGAERRIFYQIKVILL